MKSYIESLQIYQDLLWTDRADITATLHNIGNLCYSNSNYNNAMVYYLEAMRLTRLHFRQDSISMANTLNNVAWVLFMMRFHDEALKSFIQSVSIYENCGLADTDQIVEGTRRSIEDIKRQKSIDNLHKN